uniref:Uncharacterized protein n=1 Tax=Nelumbo nucifera TaxID=4432 RepID=A0A822YDJ7_NELNU|nr:TPA_asm: hypothetical protein HUJ06_031681 [Nelumbo nucifera]
MMQMEDWVLCRIFPKRRNTNNIDDISQHYNKNRVRNPVIARPSFIDFMMKDRNNSTPSSSGSSGITEVCSSDSNHDESSSCNSSFSSPCIRDA